jgi:hypothetical protein
VVYLKNFGIGKLCNETPLVEENYYCRTLYSPTMRRNFIYSYLLVSIKWDMLFGKGRVERLLNGN